MINGDTVIHPAGRHPHDTLRGHPVLRLCKGKKNRPSLGVMPDRRRLWVSRRISGMALDCGLARQPGLSHAEAVRREGVYEALELICPHGKLNELEVCHFGIKGDDAQYVGVLV